MTDTGKQTRGPREKLLALVPQLYFIFFKSTSRFKLAVQKKSLDGN